MLVLAAAFGAGCVVGQSEARTCRIGGAIYFEGDANPADPCLTCKTDIDDGAWTRTVGCGFPDSGPGHDAGGIPDASYCTINSTVFPVGASNPDEPCQVCEPTRNPSEWSGVPIGGACDGGYCSAGRCNYGCYIAGSVVAASFDPAQVNRCCNPATSSSSWLPAFSGGASNPVASHPTRGNIFITPGANGRPDVDVLSIGSARPSWNVFHSVGAGQFGNGVTTVIQSSLSSVMRGIAGDLNGDGFTDLVIYGATPNPTLVTLFGQATGGFSSSLEYPMGSFPENGAALVDLRRLGKPDVVLGGGSLGVFLNTGDGRLAPEHLVGSGSSGETLMTGDFDGDGFADVATESSVYFGNGEGRFPTITAGFGTLVASGDFNNDFLTDLVVADAASISVYLGNQFGTFSPGFPTPLNQGTPLLATAADFNGDGLLDLVVVTTVDNELLLGRGDGTFLPAAPVLGAAPVAQLQAGDLNGDNRPDIAVFESRDAGTWTPWFNNGP